MHIALSENPNCSESRATFRLVGDLINPDVITHMTGISPTSACKKGATYVGSQSRRSYQYETGGWCLTSENAVESTSTEQHLIFLLNLLEPKKDSIKELMDQFAARADFHIYWVSATGQGGPIITVDTLRRIADFNADLDFEFQGPFDDEESES